jgi:hypothetical protein
MQSLAKRLATNIQAILTHALPCTPRDQVLVIYDEEEVLTRLVLDAYRANVPWAMFLSFPEEGPEVVKRAIERLSPGALVILVQSSSFRLDAFRIRIELFRRGLRTIEHPHLNRLKTDAEIESYVDSLAYDPAYYHSHGEELTKLIQNAKRLKVVSRDGHELMYTGPFEEPKKNTGDYRDMENVGGTFPIGEVFTELVDLTRVQGTASVFAYGGMDFRTRIVEPFQIQIVDGMLVHATGAPAEFQEILAMVNENESAFIRELGFGLNRAFSKEHPVADITTFERQLGVHVSLGEKHTIYRKEGMKPKETKYHIDLFVDVAEVWFDDHCGFKDGAYLFPSTSKAATGA